MPQDSDRAPTHVRRSLSVEEATFARTSPTSVQKRAAVLPAAIRV
jgi:hypothetical protein